MFYSLRFTFDIFMIIIFYVPNEKREQVHFLSKNFVRKMYFWCKREYFYINFSIWFHQMHNENKM